MRVKLCKWVQDFKVKRMQKVSKGTPLRCILEYKCIAFTGEEEDAFLIAKAHELHFLTKGNNGCFISYHRFRSN